MDHIRVCCVEVLPGYMREREAVGGIYYRLDSAP